MGGTAKQKRQTTTDKQEWENAADAHADSRGDEILSDSAFISGVFVPSFYVFCKTMHFSSSDSYTDTQHTHGSPPTDPADKFLIYKFALHLDTVTMREALLITSQHTRFLLCTGIFF